VFSELDCYFLRDLYHDNQIWKAIHDSSNLYEIDW